MTDVRRVARRTVATVLASTALLPTGCGSTDADQPGTAAASTPPSETQPPSGTGCGADLTRAVQFRSPGFGDIAVDECRDGWAYLGAAEGRGDTEQLWHAEDGSWRWVTSMPSTLCPVDLQEVGAPRWVVALLAYRDYAC